MSSEYSSITATLLGSVAVSPQAAENINNVIKHILSTSISHQQDGKLQLPGKNEEVTEKSGLKVLLASAVYTL